MKGIILAGGTGSRLQPLTNFMNKHLLPVGKYPMIHYAIQKLSDAGISDIMIIIGKQSGGIFLDYLGSGISSGVHLTYRIQEQAGGIAQALALTEGFVLPGEKMIMLLGDNLFLDSLTPLVQIFDNQTEGAMVMLKQVHNPKRYGVPQFDQMNRIVRIVEKPEQPMTDFCVTGIYFYHSDVFQVIREILPSERGELEITDVNNVYASKGLLSYQVLDGWWIDAGTHESLVEASKYMPEANE
jgi:glucose-1-phosphate thymidylyltransferase